jgi:hypothetical protein
VTPYLGFRVPYGTGDYYLTFTDGSQLVVRDERGGGSALGLMVEGQVHGPLSVVAAGTFSTGTPDDVFIPFEDGVQRIRFDGPNIFFARAGLSYRLPEPDPDHPALPPGRRAVGGARDGVDAPARLRRLRTPNSPAIAATSR